MLKIFLAIVLGLSLLVSISGVIFASDYQFNTVVSRKAGVVAKVIERINLMTRFSVESKARYWQKLTDIRLAELKMEVDENNVDLIEETASRYSTYLGNYSEFVMSRKIESQKDTILAQFESHTDILTKLRDKFEYDSGWWLMIQHDINTIKIFKDRLSQQL